MEYFVISAKFVPLKYYTLSSQLRRLTSFSVGLFGSANSVTRSYPVMRKSCIVWIYFVTNIFKKKCPSLKGCMMMHDNEIYAPSWLHHLELEALKILVVVMACDHCVTQPQSLNLSCKDMTCQWSNFV